MPRNQSSSSKLSASSDPVQSYPVLRYYNQMTTKRGQGEYLKKLTFLNTYKIDTVQRGIIFSMPLQSWENFTLNRYAQFFHHKPYPFYKHLIKVRFFRYSLFPWGLRYVSWMITVERGNFERWGNFGQGPKKHLTLSWSFDFLALVSAFAVLTTVNKSKL